MLAVTTVVRGCALICRPSLSGGRSIALGWCVICASVGGWGNRLIGVFGKSRIWASVLLLGITVAACGATPSAEIDERSSATTDIATMCDDVADDLIVEIQDFLDELASRDPAKAAPVAPLEKWLLAYADHHRARARFIAFASDSADDAAVIGVAARIEGFEGVRSVEGLTALEALEEARALFADEPAMLAVIEADPEAIPGLVRIDADSERIDGLVTEVQAMPEVGRVMIDETTVELLEAGLEALGVAVKPDFANITKRAEEVGCDDLLLDLLKERRDRLSPTGEAATRFVAVLNDDSTDK